MYMMLESIYTKQQILSKSNDLEQQYSDLDNKTLIN